MKASYFVTGFLLFIAQLAFGQLQPTSNVSVFYSGAMKNVMWKGALQGTIALDTIADRSHLYGIGPLEQLAGEIMVIDGHVYTASVMPDSSMQVKENSGVKTPFFVCAHLNQWQEAPLPDSINNLAMLEQYLSASTLKQARPFAFRLTGSIDAAVIHVVNLPAGRKVSTPEEAHEGTVQFSIKQANVEILGFFSTSHKGIFTHHDSNLHMHLMTTDHQQMGHLEKLHFQRQALKLYLPL